MYILEVVKPAWAAEGPDVDVREFLNWNEAIDERDELRDAGLEVNGPFQASDDPWGGF